VTPISKIDARIKLFVTVFLMVLVFLDLSLWYTTFIVGGLILLFVIIIMIVGHVSFLSLLKSLSGIWILLIFLMVINIFVNTSQDYKMEAFKIGSYQVYYESFLQSGKIMLRLFIMISLSLVFTATSQPLEITSAIEWYLTPLKWIKVPVAPIAMTIALALRFIPLIFDEAKKVQQAQGSRGVMFNSGGPIARIKSMVSLIIPLFIAAFERSDQLAEAMEARGYDPLAKRTKYRKLTFHLRDLFVMLFILALGAGIIYLSVTKTNILVLLQIIK
jgi:energy-coupling factor transport system permease protein